MKESKEPKKTTVSKSIRQKKSTANTKRKTTSRVKKGGSRAKGALGELELAKYISEKFGLNARRTQQFCGNSGDASDVVVDELPDLHIECKRNEALQIWPALVQAKRDAGEKKFPTVMHRPNNREWIVVLELKDFMPIFMAASGLDLETLSEIAEERQAEARGKERMKKEETAKKVKEFCE